MPRIDQVIRPWHLIRLLKFMDSRSQKWSINYQPTISGTHRTVRRDFAALEAAGLFACQGDGQVSRAHLCDH